MFGAGVSDSCISAYASRRRYVNRQRTKERGREKIIPGTPPHAVAERSLICYDLFSYDDAESITQTEPNPAPGSGNRCSGGRTAARLAGCLDCPAPRPARQHRDAIHSGPDAAPGSGPDAGNGSGARPVRRVHGKHDQRRSIGSDCQTERRRRRSRRRKNARQRLSSAAPVFGHHHGQATASLSPRLRDCSSQKNHGASPS